MPVSDNQRQKLLQSVAEGDMYAFSQLLADDSNDGLKGAQECREVVKEEFQSFLSYLKKDTPIQDVPVSQGALNTAVEKKKSGHYVIANRFYAIESAIRGGLGACVAVGWVKVLSAAGAVKDAIELGEYVLSAPSYKRIHPTAWPLLEENIRILKSLVEQKDWRSLSNRIDELAGTNGSHIRLEDIDVYQQYQNAQMNTHNLRMQNVGSRNNGPETNQNDQCSIDLSLLARIQSGDIVAALNYLNDPFDQANLLQGCPQCQNIVKTEFNAFFSCLRQHFSFVESEVSDQCYSTIGNELQKSKYVFANRRCMIEAMKTSSISSGILKTWFEVLFASGNMVEAYTLLRYYVLCYQSQPFPVDYANMLQFTERAVNLRRLIIERNWNVVAQFANVFSRNPDIKVSVNDIDAAQNEESYSKAINS